MGLRHVQTTGVVFRRCLGAPGDEERNGARTRHAGLAHLIVPSGERRRETNPVSGALPPSRQGFPSAFPAVSPTFRGPCLRTHFVRAFGSHSGRALCRPGDTPPPASSLTATPRSHWREPSRFAAAVLRTLLTRRKSRWTMRPDTTRLNLNAKRLKDARTS